MLCGRCEFYLVFQAVGKIVEVCHCGLFLDLAVYSIITEDNASQYYPDYAYNHPLFTQNMRIYSDSIVSEFLSSIDESTSVMFQNDWNAERNQREVYFSYDSTSKICEAGDLRI